MKYRTIKIKVMAAFSAAVVGIASICGGAYAYMTNTQAAANVLTAGKVKISLTEPNWPGNDTKETTEITPNQEISKDPQITNTGTTSAVVFAEVEVPIDTYDIAKSSGERQGEDARELFWFKTRDTKVSNDEDTIHDGEGEWNWLKDLCYFKDVDGNFTDHAVSGGSAVHVFGYQTILQPGETTVPVFDKVQLKNIALHNGESLPAGDALQIDVRAFAIQGSYVLGDDSTDGGDLTIHLTTDNLIKIFERYCNQNDYQLGSGNVHKNDSEETGKYTITLTGDGIREKAIKTGADGVVKNLPSPIRTGYVFSGWEDENHKDVANGDVISSDITLRAKWTLETYKITYDLAGGALQEGEGNPDSYTIESDSFTLHNPVKDGYIFDGWMGAGLTDTKNSVTVSKGSAGDRAYTAVWTKKAPKTYRVTFAINNNNLPLQDVLSVVKEGDKAEYSFTDSHDGYEFLGWYNKAEGGNKLEEIVPTSDMTVYAHWKLISYQLAYDLDGGVFQDGADHHSSYTIETQGFTLPVPEKDGFTFEGWKEGESAPQKTITIRKGSTGNRSFTAVWKENATHTITLKAGNGDKDSTIPVKDQKTAGTLPSPEREGYRFDGWFTKKTGGSKVTGVEVITEDATYYGHWTAISYHMSYDLAGGEMPSGKENPNSYTIESESFTLQNPQKTGYTFAGWKENEKPPKETITILKGSMGDHAYTAVWTKNPDKIYTVTWHMGYTDETAVQQIKDGNTLGTLKTPVWEGHIFNGWYTQKTGGEKVTGDTVITKDTDLYARWTEEVYQITYAYNGGILSDGTTNPASYTAEGRSKTKIVYPKRDGYSLTAVTITGNKTGDVFTKTGDDLSGGWREGLGKSFIEDITVSFTWKQNPVKITYHTSSGVFQDGSNENVLSVQDGKVTSGTYQVPTREKYTFDHWFTSDGQTVKVDANGIPEGGATKDMSLSAYWMGNINYVVYDANGGTFKNNASTNRVPYVAWEINDAGKYQEPKREGYTFTGWYEDSASTKPADMNGDGNGPKKFGENKSTSTLYAGWKAKSYRITYDLSGGVLDGENPSSYTAEDSFTLKNPTKDGYIFAGWKQNESTDVQKNVTIEKGTTGNLTFLAVFEKDNSYIEIQYNLDGGTTTEALPERIERTQDAFELPIPEKADYIFDGWVKNESGAPSVHMMIHPESEEQSLTIRAAWHKAQMFTVSYHPENGADSQSVSYKEGTTIPSMPKATWGGYTFDGWYTEKEGGEKVTEETVITSDMTLYGHWTPIVYHLTYETNGGTFKDGVSNPETYTRKDKVTITYPHRAGYRLVKVTYASATDSFVKTGEDMSDYISTGLGKAFNSDVTVTFEWKQTPFKITYHTTPGTFQNGEHENTLQVMDGALVDGTYEIPTRKGYSLQKWFLAGDTAQTEVKIGANGIPEDGVTGDMDLYAFWMQDVYTISYDLDGGHISGSYQTKYTVITRYTLPVPVKDGYTFAGWTGSNGTTPETEVVIPTGTTGNLSYQAHWIAKYTVTYHPGNDTQNFSTEISENETLNVLPAGPVRDGYTFSGWFLDEACTKKLTVPYVVTKDTDVWAKWDKVKHIYHIALSVNEGIMPDGQTTVQTDDDGVLRAVDTPTRTGYTFTGWYTDTTLTNKAEFPMPFTQDGALFAGWEKNKPAKAEPVTLTGDTALKVSARFDKHASAEDMTYLLASSDEKTIQAVTNGAISIAKAEAVIAQGTAAGKTAESSFGDVTFTEKGTYHFTVSLSNIVAPSYWTYDLSVKEITVTVTEKGGVLSAEVSGDDAVFVNTYDKVLTDPAVLTGKYAMKAEVSAVGADATEIYTLKMEPADDDTRTAIANGIVTLSSDTADTGSKLSESETKTVTFGDVTIRELGVYRFRIHETNASPADTDWTYANAESDAQIITVNVEPGEDHSYKISIGNNSPLFANVYKQTPMTPVVLTGKHAIKVTCAVTGKDSLDIFTYSIEPQNQATMDAVTTGNIVLANTSAETSGPIANGSQEVVTFGDITFKLPGTYSFTIRETNETVPEGWTYATSPADAVTVTVKITRNVQDKKVTYEVSYDNTVFTNSYKEPEIKYYTPQQFGAVADDTGDDTVAFNRALQAAASSSSTDTVFVPAGMYMIKADGGDGGVQVLSKTKLKMDPGAVLQVITNAERGYNCVRTNGVTDAEISGGTICGDRTTHIGTSGEWGHGIGIYDSTDVTISNVTVKNCWGDGVYIGTANDYSTTAKSRQISLSGVTTDNNRRNGLSVVAADGVTVDGCLFVNTNGTDPQAGIDIETNHWKTGDMMPCENITISHTTCSGNTNYSILFPTWCDNVTVKDSTMNGSVYQQMGRNVVFDNTTVLTSGRKDHLLNRGLILKNGSGFNSGTEAADTLIASMAMNQPDAGALLKYNYDEQSLSCALLDDITSAFQKTLQIRRTQQGTEEGGIGYAVATMSGGKLAALEKGKTYRVEWTAKADAGTLSVIKNTSDNGTEGGFAYPWAINVTNPAITKESSKDSSLQVLSDRQGYWSFCPDGYYTTFEHLFTSKGTENAAYIYDLATAANTGLYVSDVKLYEVN